MNSLNKKTRSLAKAGRCVLRGKCSVTRALKVTPHLAQSGGVTIIPRQLNFVKRACRPACPVKLQFHKRFTQNEN